jgi:hypothetical protein
LYERRSREEADTVPPRHKARKFAHVRGAALSSRLNKRRPFTTPPIDISSQQSGPAADMMEPGAKQYSIFQNFFAKKKKT